MRVRIIRCGRPVPFVHAVYLVLDKVSVDASLRHQLGVASLLHYGPVAEAAYLVRVSHGRQAMGNDDRRSTTGCLKGGCRGWIHEMDTISVYHPC